LLALACGGGSDDPDGSGATGGTAGTGNGGTVGSHSAGGSSGSAGGSGSAGTSVPDTSISAAPPGLLGVSAPASFAFECSDGGCSFECNWDGDGFEACSSPAARAGWADGEHSFAVRALRAGLTDASPATASFTVDGVLPTLTLALAPADQLNSRASAFSFACSETTCTFECSLDDAAYAPCNAQTSLDALAPGAHTLQVRALDAAANASAAPATHTWNLDFGWRSLAVAARTACAVSGERKLYCWGSDSQGLLGDGGVPSEVVGAAAAPTRVGGASHWDSVLGGAGVLCATTTSGAHQCWGSNRSGIFGDPALPPDQNYLQPSPVSTNYPTLRFGDAHACALDTAGRLLCWGDGEYGLLGDGVIEEHQILTPTLVGTATWKALATGSAHTCGIQTDGSLHCFGRNDAGETGQPGSTENVATPTPVGSDSDWTDVAAGASFTCARKTSGALYCWGANPFGQLGNGTRISSETPTQVGSDSDWKNISVQATGACAVKVNGSAWCWGSNERGEIGSRYLAADATGPVQIESNEAIAHVLGSAQLRCAKTDTDQIRCWGDNTNSGGGLGRGVTGGEPEPYALDTNYTTLAITTNPYGGLSHGGCGIKTDGKLYCWGIGRHVGIAGTPLALVPTALSDVTGWTALDLTNESTPLSGSGSNNGPYGHACAIRAGELYCWGANDYGQLGLGDTAVHSTPTQVTAVPTAWQRVAVGTYSTCAIDTNGDLYCWGRNQFGELGQADTVQRSTPTQVPSDEDWDAVAVSSARVVAHQVDGSLWLWGAFAGSFPSRADGLNGLTPTTDWVDGRAGSNFWCGIKSDKTLQCRTLTFAMSPVLGITDVDALFKFDNNYCGKRAGGQLFCIRQEGTDWVESLAPYLTAPAGSDWLSYDTGNQLSCGIKAGGQRFCKGPRTLGSLGDGFDERVPAPILLPSE